VVLAPHGFPISVHSLLSRFRHRTNIYPRETYPPTP
jgi:hypothetical protein